MLAGRGRAKTFLAAVPFSPFVRKFAQDAMLFYSSKKIRSIKGGLAHGDGGSGLAPYEICMSVGAGVIQALEVAEVVPGDRGFATDKRIVTNSGLIENDLVSC